MRAALDDEVTVVVERHEVADLGVLVFAVGNGPAGIGEGIRKHAGAAARLNLHQAGEHCFGGFLRFAVAVFGVIHLENALHAGQQIAVGCKSDGFDAAVGLAILDDVGQAAAGRQLGLDPAAGGVHLEHEGAVLVGHPQRLAIGRGNHGFGVDAVHVKCDAALRVFENLQGVADRRFTRRSDRARRNGAAAHRSAVDVLERGGAFQRGATVALAGAHSHHAKLGIECGRGKRLGRGGAAVGVSQVWRISVRAAIRYHPELQIALLVHALESQTRAQADGEAFGELGLDVVLIAGIGHVEPALAADGVLAHAELRALRRARALVSEGAGDGAANQRERVFEVRLGVTRIGEAELKIGELLLEQGGQLGAVGQIALDVGKTLAHHIANDDAVVRVAVVIERLQQLRGVLGAGGVFALLVEVGQRHHIGALGATQQDAAELEDGGLAGFVEELPRRVGLARGGIAVGGVVHPGHGGVEKDPGLDCSLVHCSQLLRRVGRGGGAPAAAG